jgi:hypothetical protein
MSKNLKLLGALLSLFLLLTSVGVILVTKHSQNIQGDAVVSDTQFVSELTKCSNNRWDFNTLKNSDVFACQDNVLRKYVNSGNMADLDIGLNKISKNNPTFWLPCHDLLHKAGESQVTNLDKGIMLLGNISQATCQGGLVHGVLDGIAGLRLDKNDFEKISRACNNYNKHSDSREAGRLVNYCADGAGHAAWSTGKNLEQAVSYCDTMIDRWQSSICAEGIIMQMFEPANDVATYTLDYGYANLYKICSTWPSELADKPSLAGCHKGAAYVYTRLSRKLDLELNNKNPDLSKPLADSEKQDLYDSLMFAKNQCDKHTTSEGVSLCYEGISWQIPVMFFLAEDHLNKYCDLLNEHAQTCKTVNATRWSEQDSLIIE